MNEYFKRYEFACKCGCGFNTVDAELLVVLTDIRVHFQKPVHILSGCRCKNHNLTEGGYPTSKHLVGQAADFYIPNIHADIVAKYLLDKYVNTYGIGRYTGRTHVDVRSTGPARWDYR